MLFLFILVMKLRIFFIYITVVIVKRTYVCIIVHSLYRTIILESMHQSALFLFFLFGRNNKIMLHRRQDNKKQYIASACTVLSFIFLDDAPPIYYFRHYFSVFVIKSSISWCFCVCIFFIIIFVFLLFRVHPVNFSLVVYLFSFFFISFCFLDPQQR